MGDVVCIGSCSGTFFALDRRTGQPRWARDVRPGGRPTSFHGDPLVTDSLIVIGSDGGTPESRLNHVWAFAHDGTVRWKTPLEGGIVSDIVRDGDRAFAITRTDSLLCLDLATGRRLWSFAADDRASEERFLYRSPSVVSRRVFVGDMEGRVHALATGSGRVLWTRSLGSEICTGMLAIGGDLLLADVHGRVHRIDQATGAIRASYPVGATFEGPPVNAGDSLALFAGREAILALHPASGAVRWRHDLRLSSARPYLRRGSVIAATEEGDVVAFRARDGMPQWSRAFPGIVRGIGWDDRTLYLGTEQGMLYAHEQSAPP